MYDDILEKPKNKDRNKNKEPCAGFKHCKNKEFNIYDDECKKCIMNGGE